MEPLSIWEGIAITERGAVAIILFNSIKFAERCLAALYKNLPRDVGIIVVDNGSSSDVTEPLRKVHTRPHFVRLAENHGPGSGFNAACHFAFSRKAGAIYLVNDDAEVRPGFWEACEAVVRTHGPAIVASVPLNFDPPHTIQSRGVTFKGREMEYTYLGGGEPYDSQQHGFFESDAVVGVGFLLPREAWEAIGPFTEKFGVYYEDFDYCIRARKAGFAVGTALSSSILHHGNQTTGPRSPRFLYYYLRNDFWFRRIYMPARDFLLIGRLHVIRKAIFFLRTDANVRKNPASVRAVLAAIKDGLFGNPERTRTPSRYR